MIWKTRTAAMITLAGLAGSCQAAPVGGDTLGLNDGFIGPVADAEAYCGETCVHGSGLRAMRIAAAEKMIEAQTFFSLPTSHQQVIAEKLEELGEPIPGAELASAPEGWLDPLSEDEFASAFEIAGEFVDRETFEGFAPVHQRMLAEHIADLRDESTPPKMFCFAPDTDPKLVAAFSDAFYGIGGDNLGRFEGSSRWNRTALDPAGGGLGNPTILTYSFPDDGVPSQSGLNSLNGFFDGIYGNRATWRAFYDEIFARWGELSGNTYVLEVDDNRAYGGSNSGVAGVRGDLRMWGQFIDGNSNVLAFNSFPGNGSGGDMVMDTGDNFYNNTGGRSIRLRNVLAHEHGHGFGAAHVCPVRNFSLMEPFININFDGPQYDDILGIQRRYGDASEPNDSIEEATVVGLVGDQIVTIDTVSVDDELDVDLYEIEISEVTELRVTLRNTGFLYQAGVQTGDCNELQPYNPSFFLNGGLDVRNASGQFIAFRDVNPAGDGEELSINVGPGTYYVGVFGGTPTGDQIISYELDLIADGIASFIQPEGEVVIEGRPGEEIETLWNIGTGGFPLESATISYRAAGETDFTTEPLEPLGNDVFRGVLPAFDCGEDPEYFITADVAGGSPATFPIDGAAAPNSIIITDGLSTQVDADGEADVGFVVSGNATEGQWQRGFPQDNGRQDPGVDADGSGQAWLTGIEEFDSNSDVDNGRTVLTTPEYDFSATGEFNYSYWFNTAAFPGSGQFLSVEYSLDNGATWEEIRFYNEASNEWRDDSIDVESEVGLVSSIRFRFIAADEGPQSGVVEAGVDAIFGQTRPCGPVGPVCLADTNFDGILNGADFNSWLAAFAGGEDIADQNQDGVLNGADFNAWLGNFAAGCD